MSNIKRSFGWRPDLPDQRDFQYAVPRAVLTTLPPSVDLAADCPPVYDQGDLGSCTANAIAGAFEYDEMKEKLAKVFTPSRLFIYYGERAIEGSIGEDSGAQIRDGIKVIAKQGVCPETEWPYDIQKFTKKPPKSCYTHALKDRAVSYERLTQDLNSMKGCLAEGFPFIYGFTVYESIRDSEVEKTGVLPMPTTREKVLGGHAILAVGYEDATQRIKFRNSWGDGWGDKGYGYMPYAYITDSNLADDFWTVRTVICAQVAKTA